jgi:hypothetical protein
MFVLSSRAFPSSPLRINPWLEGRMMIHHLSLSLSLSISLYLSLSRHNSYIEIEMPHHISSDRQRERESQRKTNADYNYLFDKKKGKLLFFTVFFSSAKKGTSLFSTRTKKQWKKVFLFIEHEVLFYETPFLHRARRNYVCGACETTAD